MDGHRLLCMNHSTCFELSRIQAGKLKGLVNEDLYRVCAVRLEELCGTTYCEKTKAHGMLDLYIQHASQLEAGQLENEKEQAQIQSDSTLIFVEREAYICMPIETARP